MIKAKINADGVVEKPDVVGAIFGQTEGLLGDELDLRDLQKSGRIGRIEVEVTSKGGKSDGIVYVSSSLDQVETAILASALETIDRVGPCKATISVLGIEDVRITKREQVIDRAKELLSELIKQSKGTSSDLTESIRQSIQVEEITSYGKDRCPAGPNVKDSEAIIIVEGRSDVLNLLRAGIKNAIAVEGTNIPKTVQDLSRERVATAFVDGDRGGELILRELFQVAEVDFVARAPRAHEVEELTAKQLVKCLRNKVPGDQYMEMNGLLTENSNKSEDEESVRSKERSEHNSDRNGDRPRRDFREDRNKDRNEDRFRRDRESRIDKESHSDRNEEKSEKEREPKVERELRNTDRNEEKSEKEREPARDFKKKDRFNTEAVEKYKKKEPVEERVLREKNPVKIREEVVASVEKEENVEEEEKPKTFRNKKEATRKTKSLSPEQEKYRDMLLDMSSTHNAKVLNSENQIVREIAVKSLVDSLKENSEGVTAIVFDGVISQRIIDVSADKGIMTVVGTRKGNISKMPAGIAIWTKEDLY
ncbi:MAG: DNA primase DnaG [Candidatus Methanomethylophilaceae archaeon]|jgi:DNA primase